MNKKKIFGIVVFLLISFFVFTFANPNDEVKENEEDTTYTNITDTIRDDKKVKENSNVTDNDTTGGGVIQTNMPNQASTPTGSQVNNEENNNKNNQQEEIKNDDENKLDNKTDEENKNENNNQQEEVKNDDENKSDNKTDDENKTEDNNQQEEVKNDDENKSDNKTDEENKNENNNQQEEVKNDDKNESDNKTEEENKTEENNKDDLEDAIKKAIEEVENYNSEELYSKDNKEKINSIKEEAINDLNNAKSIEEVENIVEAAKSEIDKIQKLTETYYTVIFKDADGSTLKEEQVLYSKSATAPEIAEYTTRDITYGLDSWDKDYSSVKSNLIVTANYKIIKIEANIYRLADDVAIPKQNKASALSNYTKAGKIELKITPQIINIINNNKVTVIDGNIQSYVNSKLPQSDEEFYYYNYYVFKFEPSDGFHIDYQRTFDSKKYYNSKLNELNSLLNADYSEYKETKTTDSYENLINTINKFKNRTYDTVEEIEIAINEINSAISGLIGIKVIEISISSNNDVYNIGDKMKEITVTAIYNDSSRNVKLDNKINEFDSSSAGVKSIIYSHNGVTATYNYTVKYSDIFLNNKASNVTATLEKVKIKDKGFKKEYEYRLYFNKLNDLNVSSVQIANLYSNEVVSTINLSNYRDGAYILSEEDYYKLRSNNTLFSGNVIRINYTYSFQAFSYDYHEFFGYIR